MNCFLDYARRAEESGDEWLELAESNSHFGITGSAGYRSAYAEEAARSYVRAIYWLSCLKPQMEPRWLRFLRWVVT